MTDDGTKSPQQDHELIAFRVGGQEFCVDIMSIREIRGWVAATAIPAAPHFVRGVINLRGTVLPIVDLAARLGLPKSEPTARHAIMVSEIRRQVVGLLVEGVSDIFTVSRSDVQSMPHIASETSNSFVDGIIALERRLIGVLDLNGILPGHISQAA